VNQRKGIWLIDTDAQGITGYEEILLSVPKKLAILRGNLEDLLADKELAFAEDAWCQVTLTDPERPADAMSKVRTRFPDTVVLAFDPQGGKAKEKSTYSDRMAKATSTAQVCTDFIEHVRDRQPDELERELLDSVIRSTREAQVSK
jgi:exonuclease SbcD